MRTIYATFFSELDGRATYEQHTYCAAKCTTAVDAMRMVSPGGVALDVRHGNDTMNACMPNEIAKRRRSGPVLFTEAAAVAPLEGVAAERPKMRRGRTEAAREMGTPRANGSPIASQRPRVIQIGGRKSATHSRPATSRRSSEGGAVDSTRPVQRSPEAQPNPKAK